MKTIELVFSPEMVEALGWTLVHSLWQGVLVLFGLMLILFFIRRCSAQIKYFISFVALIGILGWSSATFVHSFQYAREKQVMKEKIVSTPGYVKTFLKESITKSKDGVVNEEKINLKEVKVRSFFQRNFYIICSIWIIGIIFLIIRFTGGVLYARKLRSYKVLPITDEWIKKIEELIVRLNIKRKVSAFFSPLAKIPMTLGVVKPILLFPVSAFTGLTAREIEAIIAHELAHVLRNDYFFNILQSMVEIIFFYHPAVWMISAKIRKERENSCDNIAIQTTGDKAAFVKALASVQLHYWESQQLAMGFAGKKNNVLHRIKRLQNNIVMKTNFIEGLIAAGVIIVGLALASFTNIEKIKAKEMAVASSPDSVTVVVTKKQPINPADIDSIRTSMENNLQEYKKKGNSDEELQKMVEVALSEDDQEHSAEMMEEINRSIKEMDIEETVRVAMDEASRSVHEAMIEASEAMKEASVESSNAIREAAQDVRQSKDEIDREEINHEMNEAAREIEEAKREMAEDMRRDMYRDGIDRDIVEASIKAAQVGLDVAAGVVSTIDIDGIVSAALSGVGATLDALSEIDYDSSHHDCRYEHRHSGRDDCRDGYRQIDRKERQKEKLRSEKEDLKRKLDQLEKELDNMDEE